MMTFEIIIIVLLGTFVLIFVIDRTPTRKQKRLFREKTDLAAQARACCMVRESFFEEPGVVQVKDGKLSIWTVTGNTFEIALSDIKCTKARKNWLIGSYGWWGRTVFALDTPRTSGLRIGVHNPQPWAAIFGVRVSPSLLDRLFANWQLPARHRVEFEREGIVLEENVRGSVTFENYRSPGFVCGWHKRWVRGTLMLTRRRLLMFTRCQMCVEIPVPTLSDRTKIQCGLEDENHIRILFRAESFLPNHSGKVTLRLRTPTPRQLIERLVAEGFETKS
jgi:hypothetical protein